MPSHHQHDFFSELAKNTNIDLCVRYFGLLSEERKKLGWVEKYELADYEQVISNNNVIASLNSIEKWDNKVHIIPGLSTIFLKELVRIFIQKNINWIYWSERGGISLFSSLRDNLSLFTFLKPIFDIIQSFRIGNKVNKYALGAFAIGQLAKNDFLRWGIDKDKIEYLFYSKNPLDHDLSVFYKDNNKNEKRFLFIGELSRRKGTNILVKAFSLLQNTKEWKLVLVGPDENNYYLKKINTMCLENKIVFKGVIKSNEIGNIISTCNILVLPSLFDGWGLVLNEATSLSKPVIATDQCGAANHLIKNGENGFIIKAKSIKQLQIAMQYYIDNPQIIEQHGKYSKMLFQSYTPAENVIKFIDSIRKWIDRSKQTQ
jgi:glycosyltransferase involved in cell wall biosynthesis